MARKALILALEAAHGLTFDVAYALGWGLALLTPPAEALPLRREGNVVYLPPPGSKRRAR